MQAGLRSEEDVAQLFQAFVDYLRRLYSAGMHIKQ